MSKEEQPQQGRRISVRGLRALVIASALVVLLGAGGVWATLLSGSGSEKAEPTALPTATSTPTPTPTGYACTADGVVLSEQGDSFDWWQQSTTATEASFSGSADSHSGAYSTLIHSELPPERFADAQLVQTFPVTPGDKFDIGFWVKSEGSTSGAIILAIGPDGYESNLVAPSGGYGWTEVSSFYEVPEGQTSIDVRVVAQGNVDKTWIDDISFRPSGSAGDMLRNGGFETNSAELTVTNSSLFFEDGEAFLEVGSKFSEPLPFHWIVRNSAGAVAAEGDSSVVDGEVRVDLASLPRGYYDVTLTALRNSHELLRELSLAVVDGSSTLADVNESRFGVHLHFEGGEARVANIVDDLHLAGVGHVREDVPWWTSEPTAGVYDYPNSIRSASCKYAETGMTPLLLPVYSNPLYDNGQTPSSEVGLDAYANFAADVADTFSELDGAVEVYNEFDHTFNTGACGPTAACYLEMLSRTSSAVKAAAPETLIVAPGNAGMGFKLDWLSEFFPLGGLAYTDVVSAHPYVQPDAPEKLVGELETLRQMIAGANGGVAKPIWITEMGWASVDGWVSDQEQAEYIVRMAALSFGHGVSRVYWYEGADQGLQTENGEKNFGLFEAATATSPSTYAPKLAAVAQAVLASQIGDMPFAVQDDLGPTNNSYAFGDAAEAVRVVWSTNGSGRVRISTETTVTVTSMLGEVATFDPVAGVVDLDVTGSPIYVNGNVAAISSL